MRILCLPLLAALLLTGCTHHYVITTSNGRKIDTSTKPKIKGGFYVYKDALGREQSVLAGRVTEIAPASMSHSEKDNYTFQPK